MTTAATRRPGRPTKRSSAVEATILNALRRGHSTEAATSAGRILSETWRAWLRRDDELRERAAIAAGLGQARFEREILAPNVTATRAAVLLWRLAIMDPESWARRSARRRA